MEGNFAGFDSGNAGSKPLDPAYYIVGVFFLFIILLLGYLYFANKSLIEKGLHHNKKYGKKT